MKCMHCGADTPAENQFCSYCRSELPVTLNTSTATAKTVETLPEEKPQIPFQPSPAKKTFGQYIAMLAIIVCVLFGSFSFLFFVGTLVTFTFDLSIFFAAVTGVFVLFVYLLSKYLNKKNK